MPLRRRMRQPKRRKLFISPSFAKIATLCGKCKVLSFNDNDIGGYEKEDFDGNKVLGLEDDDLEIDRSVKWKQLKYDHQDNLPNLPRLAASASAGCHFCEFLRIAIQNELCNRTELNNCEVQITLLYLWHRRPFLLAGSPTQVRHTESLMALVANLETFLHDGSFHTCKVFFMTEAPPGDCSAWLKLRRPPSLNALCPENISMIQEEIKNCGEICFHAEYDISFLPTRLIDLMDPQTPRLVVSADQSPRNDLDGRDIKYAALSYCWGSASETRSMLKTEKVSMKSRFAGIAFSEMPKVFQDAISLCNKLSIRYLWIDALCIVQDDRLDWEQEGSQMGKVYENAFVTVVPLAAHTCNEGFLQRSQETVEIPFQSTVRSDIDGKFYLRHVPQFNMGDRWHFSGLRIMELLSSTWSKRGWTFQEDTLSARILYFGQTMMFYECGNWERLEFDDRRYLQKRAYFKTESWQHHLSVPYETWESVVSLFSGREFTYPEDKLPAISALAQGFAEASKDEYIAGLWRGGLFRGLLWHTTPQNRWGNFLADLNTPHPYIAPSWSWASRNSYVAFGVRQHQFPESTEKFMPECEIKDINVDLRGSNPYGAVGNAVLTLSGKQPPLPSTLQLMPSSFISPTWKISKGSALVGICELDWITDREDSWQAHNVRMEMLLVVSWGKGVRKVSGRTNKCAYGLILLPTDNENEYRRVGVFYCGKGGEFTHDSPWNNRLFKGLKVQTIYLI